MKLLSAAATPPTRIETGAIIIALFNAFGIGWALVEKPAAVFLLAALVGVVSLNARRNWLARIVSIVVGSAVAYTFIFYPPEFPRHHLAWSPSRPLAHIERDYAKADAFCEDVGHADACWRRQALQRELYAAKRARIGPVQAAADTDDDVARKTGMWVGATVLLWIINKPVSGSPSAPPLQLPPFLTAPTLDLETDKLKQNDFHRWMTFGGIIRHDGQEPSVKLQDAYARYIKWIREQPGAAALDIESFQRALKVAGHDTKGNGADALVSGISFATTSLI